MAMASPPVTSPIRAAGLFSDADCSQLDDSDRFPEHSPADMFVE